MDTHHQAFETFADRLEDELGDSLEKLILYGSVAHGEATAESDIDVFVVVQDDQQKETVYQLAAATGREYGVHIAAVTRSSDEFEQTQDTGFTQEVLETGTARI